MSFATISWGVGKSFPAPLSFSEREFAAKEKLACPTEAESEGEKLSNPKGLLLPLSQGYEGHGAGGRKGVLGGHSTRSYRFGAG